MKSARHIVQSARRRAGAQIAIRGAGLGAAAGALAGAVLLAADRGLGAPVPVTAYVLLVALGSAAWAAAALALRPSRLEAAVMLDRRLGLQDRLGTAEAGAGPRSDEGFVELLRRDADGVAASIDVRAAAPIRLTRVWALAAAANAALALGLAFLPEVSRAPAARPGSDRSTLVGERHEITRTIDEAVAALDEQRLDEESREDLDTLRAVAEQLGEPASAVELQESRDRTAAALSEMAERLAEDSQRHLEAVERAAESFAGLAPPAPPPALAPRGERFQEALRRGDLARAAETFQELMESARALPPEDRRALGEQLRELAGQLEETSPSSAGDLDRRRREIERAMRDLGVPEEVPAETPPPGGRGEAREDRSPQEPPTDEPREGADPGHDEPAAGGERRGQPDPDTLQRLAEDLERVREEARREEAAREHRQRAAEALREAARELVEEPDPAGPQESARGEPPPLEEDAAPPPGDPGTQPPGSSRKPDQPSDQAPPPQGDEAPDQAPSPEPGGEPAGAESPPGSAEPPGEGPPGPTGPPREITEPQEEGGTGTPGGTAPRPGRALAEELRRLEELRREAQRGERTAEDLREAARELAGNLTPEQAEELRRRWLGDRPPVPTPPGSGPDPGTVPGAGAAGDVGEPPAFGDFADVDLRDESGPGDATIAEWLQEGDAGGGEGPASRQTHVGQARRAAERAVERSTVPSRYHSLIERYFGRLPETAERAAARGRPARPSSAPPPPPPPADGPDRP